MAFVFAEATRSSQRDSLLLWEELEAQWKDLITLSSDPSGLATHLLDVGQCLGSSYPDQVEKGKTRQGDELYQWQSVTLMFFLP